MHQAPHHRAQGWQAAGSKVHAGLVSCTLLTMPLIHCYLFAEVTTRVLVHGTTGSICCNGKSDLRLVQAVVDNDGTLPIAAVS